MTLAPAPIHTRQAHRWYAPALSALLLVVTIGVVLVVQYDVFRGPASSNAAQGSGVGVSETRHLTAFSGIELAGSNQVTVGVGRKQAVVVRGDDNLVDRVTTDVQSGNLVIGNVGESFATKSPMSVEVSVPSLEALALTGTGVVSVTGIDAARFTVTLAGGGVVRASGSTAQLHVTLDGSGVAQLERLVALDVHAVVSGAGRVGVTATKSLEASVPGGGVIVYRGDPAEVTTSVTGRGAVIRG